MSRNIEIKAGLRDRVAVEEKAAALATYGPERILQHDTFFVCANGRLKLREFADGQGELIFYRRADASGPKESFYLLSPTAHPQNLRESLRLAYGIHNEVRKERTLYLVGRTRIHLDRVEQLGDYLELEVVLEEGEAPAAGEGEAQELMAALGILTSDLVEGAYADLLQGLAKSSASPASAPLA